MVIPPLFSLLLQAARLTSETEGFPETVDKLEPEIGQLCGPKPILFGE